MNRTSLLFLIIVSTIVAATAVSAQSPRRRRPPARAAAKPVPSATPTPVAQPALPADAASPALAIVNDQVITAADIETEVSTLIMRDPDRYLQLFYQNREKERKDARVRAVDARIASMLIAAEAKKRGLTTDVYLEAEINSKIPAPVEADIRTAYEMNRDQIGNVALEAVRADIVNYLREQRRQELYAGLMNRLKMTNTVTRNADVNAPGLAPGTVLAAVNGMPLRIEAINERMKAYNFKMEMRIYEASKKALDRRINDLLLIADANKRNIGAEEIVRAEITEKLTPPTEVEISKFYEENKARIPGDLASARSSITQYLQQQQQEQLETALSKKLRTGAKFQILLKEPQPPVISVSANGPARGDATALVTVVEFTDFQCSACGAMYPVLEDALKSYGNRVRFVVRNFPLTVVHPNALRAAQAASAAHAQGKFWEYIDLLFKNQNALDSESLKKYATQVGLDRKRFDAELDSGKYDADIRRDVEDGEMYGIESTPTIFINGVKLTLPEFSAAGVRAAIDRAFARAQNRSQ